MPDEPLGPQRLTEVSELAAKLAEKALADRLRHGAVPVQSVRALAAAAMLLDEYGLEPPPLAVDLLRRVRDDEAHVDEARGASEEPEPFSDEPSKQDDRSEEPGKIARLFGALRGVPQA